jgi:hypothetical protein
VSQKEFSIHYGEHYAKGDAPIKFSMERLKINLPFQKVIPSIPSYQ